MTCFLPLFLLLGTWQKDEIFYEASPHNWSLNFVHMPLWFSCKSILSRKHFQFCNYILNVQKNRMCFTSPSLRTLTSWGSDSSLLGQWRSSEQLYNPFSVLSRTQTLTFLLTVCHSACRKGTYRGEIHTLACTYYNLYLFMKNHVMFWNLHIVEQLN